MSKTALIVGGDSTFASYFCPFLADQGYKILKTTRRLGSSGDIFLDLEKDISEFQVPEGVDVALIFAAMTSINHCEKSPVKSHAINVEGRISIIRKLVERGIFVLFPSSNHVFGDMQEKSMSNALKAPNILYGKQQSAVEDAIIHEFGKGAIVRLTKVVWPGFPLFHNWTTQLLKGKKIEGFSDLYIAPIWMQDVMSATLAILEKRKMVYFKCLARKTFHTLISQLR